MAFFLLLLFLITVIFLWPVIKVLFYVRNIKKRFKSSSSYESKNQSTQSKNKPVHKQKKKIDSDIGEYVKFEEIDTVSYEETITDNENKVQSLYEEQTIDVEWEEIKINNHRE